jgi:tRNA threonylcarbamoyladenosine biosynthesis protein TsaB
MSLILGIDTSNSPGSVALSHGDGVLEQRSLEQPGRRHAQTLVAQIAALVKGHGFVPQDLDAVGVIRGPGSFTGLRVGVVCAKTLSYSLRIPLIVLDAFDVVAAQCPADLFQVWVVDDAQRGEFFIGRYRRVADDAWNLEGERFIAAGRSWLASLPNDDVVVGPGTLRIPSDVSSPRVLRDAAISLPRAETVCRLATRHLATGEVSDCWSAAPFYIRPSAAEEKRGNS